MFTLISKDKYDEKVILSRLILLNNALCIIVRDKMLDLQLTNYLEIWLHSGQNSYIYSFVFLSYFNHLHPLALIMSVAHSLCIIFITVCAASRFS